MVTETGEWADVVNVSGMISGGMTGALIGLPTAHGMITSGLLGAILVSSILISYWMWVDWH